MEKIGKITNWMFGIIGAISAVLSIIEYKNKIIIFWIGGTSVFLFVVISLVRYFYFLKREIKRLKDRLKDVELTAKVATFKKWELVFPHLWYNNRNVNPQNDVEIDLLEIINGFRGNGKIRDTVVTFNITGRFNKPAQNFKLIFGGGEFIEFNQINFKAFDHIGKTELPAKIAPNEKGRDTRVKDVIISFKKEARRGDHFDLTVDFVWPNGANAECDYFTLSNIYGTKTGQIRFKLKRAPDMNLSKVEVYKYKISMDSPEFICDLDEEEDNTYVFESSSPEENTEYMIFYE